MKIEVWQGDITTLAVDAIVNAANETLRGGGGVDGRTLLMAGMGVSALGFIFGIAIQVVILRPMAWASCARPAQSAKVGSRSSRPSSETGVEMSVPRGVTGVSGRSTPRRWRRGWSRGASRCRARR